MRLGNGSGFRARFLRGFSACAILASAAFAQTLQFAPQRIPQGAPFNASYTENLDFADVDLDGDWDVMFADGGDFGNDQNRLWVNMGGAQGGTPGIFQDRTAQQLPAVIDDSRDVDFVDVDEDGDPDLFTSNSSQISNQSNRWWINMGGAQGGTAGFFTDQTSTRYLGLGVNNGSSHSSLAPNLVLVAGGFIDWSGDSAFADLDGDGYRDLFQSTYGSLGAGNVPAHVFLNDGQGRFEEFNPSGFQLSGSTIANGQPALWAQGLQQDGTSNVAGQFADIATVGMSVELGDLDGDLDLDILHGDRVGVPRFLRNLLVEQAGTLALRDVTASVLPQWSMGTGKYEQVLGDLDNDGDLDIYAMNWVYDFCDATFHNDGKGAFSIRPTTDSCQRESEPDLIDFDNDGDLDVFLTRLDFAERVQRNSGAAGNYAFAPAANATPNDHSHSWAADVCDLDGDGDYDAMVANDLNQPNLLLDNTSGTPDASAPRVGRVEQAPERFAAAPPTVVRAQVYDNAEDYLTGYATVSIEYSVGGGAVDTTPMRWSGGQVFRGELSGFLTGVVAYRVVATDAYGNSGASAWRSYTAAACTGEPLVYCTAKANSCGGLPAIFSNGAPSASSASGFVIEASGARAGKTGILLYGNGGPWSAPFQGGILCVSPQGLVRGPPVGSTGATSGSSCDGVFSLDMNAFASGNAGGNPAPFLSTPGQRIYAQWWGRDSLQDGPFLSDALQYDACP